MDDTDRPAVPLSGWLGIEKPLSQHLTAARQRPFRLRSYLVTLVLALLLPALGLGAAVVWQAAKAYRGAFEARLEDTSRALALAVDREIGTFTATLTGLAAAPFLDAGATAVDLLEFRLRAKEVAEALGSYITLVGPPPEYRRQAHTLVAPGAPLPAPGLRLPAAYAPLPRAFASASPALGAVACCSPTNRYEAVLFVPVIRNGHVIRALGIALDPERVARLLEAQGLPGSMLASVVDERGNIAARSREHERFVGQPAPAWFGDAVAGRESGFLQGLSVQGQEVVLGFARLASAPGWTLYVAAPWASYAASWRQPLATLALGGVLVLALGLAVTAWLGRRLLGSVGALAADAAAVAGADGKAALPPLTAPPSRVVEFEALRRGFAAADAALRARAEEARAGEARLRAAQAAGRLGVFEYDVARDRFWWSEEQYRLHGTDAGGAPPGLAAYLARVHPDDRESFAAEIEAVLSGTGPDEIRREFRFRRLDDGAERWIALDAVVTARDPRTGRAARATGTNRDVTERRAEEAALAANEERMRLAVEGTGMATWDFDAATGRLVWSRHHFLLLGHEPRASDEATVAMWRSRVHPEDLPRVEAAWARAESEGAPFHVGYRIRRADTGETRWLEAYGRYILAEPGSPGRFVGVMFDVTERKTAEERQRLLMREVDHRAKNALAVVQSVVRLTRAEDPRAFATAVEGRVRALARAHELLARDRWEGAGLREIVASEVAAYRGVEEGSAAPRVSIGGPALRLKAEAAQPVSMVLHELATNAAKYGALSEPGGRVGVSWRLDPTDGALRLRWAERGGPPVATSPRRAGFGLRLVESTVRGQLGGSVTFAWEASGLVCEITVAGEWFSGEAPAAAQAAGAGCDSPGKAAPAASLRGLRVLVAEDEALIAAELAGTLGALGCEVVGPGATVEAALRLVETGGRLDAAVLDAKLFGHPAFPVADALASRGVPVVFATGYTELPEASGGIAYTVLRKPVVPADLAAALHRAVWPARPDDPPARG